MSKDNYLGISMVVSHNIEDLKKYNALFNTLGAEGMLEQIERYIDAEDLKGIIKHIEDNLHENDIELPYKKYALR